MKRTLRRAAAPVAAAGIVGAVIAGFLLGNGSGSGVAADGSDSAANTVSVAGTGKASGIPDVLRLDMGVQHTGNDVSEALTAANSDVAKIKKALDKYDVDAKDIQTSQLSINPHYEKGKVNGYEVFQGLTVKLRDLSKAGKAISDAASAGGNATRINGVSFDIEDNAKLLQAARDAAFADAKAKAEQYANLAGRRLGNVTMINEDTFFEDRPYAYAGKTAAAGSRAGGSVPIEAGSQQVSVNSSISWELV